MLLRSDMKMFHFIVMVLLVVGSNSQRILNLYETQPEHIFKQEPPDNLKVEESRNYRLPQTIFPETYNITLEPYFEGNFIFRGYTAIKAYVVRETSEIVLHYTDLTLHEFHVYDLRKELNVVKTSYNNITEKFTLYLSSTLQPDTILLLTFRFEGLLKDDLKGFYRSSYYDAGGNRRWLATTQFEPTYARKAFPCFDEPVFKATFNLFIRRPKNYSTLTNMPLIASTESQDNILDSFEETPKMSSYLVAIIVSDFVNKTNNVSNVSVWAREDTLSGVAYAIDFGAKILDEFTILFNQSNPVPKTDMVAVPDFNSGAMENWGLITYREYLLLLFNNETPDSIRQRIGSIIAHECAHMWFGNMVSPKWWSYTWLNEGFANYFQSVGTSMIENTWKYDQQFVLESVQPALFYDSNLYTVPVSKNVFSQKMIKNMFGTITYNKGGSIIRMMHYSFGPEVFYEALKDYIRKYKYSNVDSDDLWKVLQNTVDMYELPLNATVKELMNNWINEPGYPLLFVNVDKDKVTLKQARFLSATTTKLAPGNTTWYIPITYTIGNTKVPNFNLTTTNMWINEDVVLSIPNVTDSWIIFNNLQSGFYRVNYDIRSWYRIIQALKSKNFYKIHEINRAALIDDLMNLARAELVDYEIVLDGLQYLTQETNYLPFKAAINGIKFLTYKFVNHEDYILYARHILNLIEKTYKKIGFFDNKKDDQLTILLRQELNELACKLEHPKCLTMVSKTFAAWRKSEKKKPFTIPKNQRSVIYCYAMRNGTRDDWEFLKNYMNNVTDNVYERLLILRSLACVHDPVILEKYLLTVLSDFDKEYQIRKQESTSLFVSVINSGLHGTKYMLKFLVKYHAKITEYYGDYEAVANLIAFSARNFNTESQIKEFENYVSENAATFKPIQHYLPYILDSLKEEVNWYNRNSGRILQWLYKMYPGTKGTQSVH